MIRIILALGICGVLSLALVLCYNMYFPNHDSSEKIIFDVAPGDSFSKVSDKLILKKFVKNKKIFLFYTKVLGLEKKLKPGEYELNYNMSPSKIIQTLISQNSYARSITFIEGLNVYEVANILSREQLIDKEVFLNLTKDQIFIENLLGEKLNSLEGFLFPETYRIEKYMGERAIITMMVNNFLKVYARVNSTYNKYIRNRNDVITLASIIEKETGASFERSIISSVFYNRLRRGMKLQSDPTIIYGILMTTGIHITNIRRRDITSQNEYNTYHIYGLPKSPIANPGEDSIRAVFNPADTKYLYFVSKNNGTHKFSKNYKEHQRAVNFYQK